MLPKKFLSNWIWMDRWEQEDTAVPHMVYFRKKYHSSEKISISANCRYKLYINGNFVQEGPQKGTAEMAYVDEARIGAYAKDGENVAAVEVLYYPEDGARRNDSLYYSPYPCLYIEDADRKKELDGKEGWKYFHAKQIQFVGEPYDPAPIHGSEIVRGEESVRGWMERDYDDSWWGEAKPYSIVDAVNPVAPFYMEKRTIPLMRHEPCCLQEVVCVREAGGREEETVKRQWNALLKEHVSVHIPAHTTQIVELSAGEEMCGYPTLALKGGRGAEVEILYSESYGIPQPDMKTLIGTRPVPPLKTDRTDFRHGCLQGTTDIYRVSGYGTDQAPERYTPYLFRTFRYIQVKITTGEQGVAILRYDYISTGYPLEVKTHLTTSDETLNKIWDMSVRTMKRCMHETYLDCPFYEQLQYAMDSRTAILFTYSISADDRLARQCMEAFRRTQRSDGILQASAPATKVNVIPGFSIYYILMLHDHMMYFGDKALIREHFGCVDRILEFFHNHRTEKGLVGKIGDVLYQHPYWSFIDWSDEWEDTIGMPTAGRMGDGSITMESLLYLHGLRHAAELADYIGRGEVAMEYTSRAQRLKEAILEHCTGRDGLIQDGPGLELYSTHCQVWAILNNLLTSEQGRHNLERTFRADGIPQCSVSMSFYLLQALKKVDWLDKADEMWDPWRTMIKNNMTTCVENFLDQRSDCHAWGALILYALPAIYLGIRPAKPGFTECTNDPDLGHLKWITGQVVTPNGIISV